MARPGPAPVRISRRILDRYLLSDETAVVATRHHWAKLVEPVTTSLLSLVLVAVLSAATPWEARYAATALWLVWMGVLGRAIWKLLEWRNEWFVATDRRLLLTYGMLTQKVAMMPLAKVTDMNYGRSLLGRLLGYGQFVLESAGQDQALRKISWVPDPDEKYRRMCATIFSSDEADMEDRPEDPFETSFEDNAPSFTDHFDPDVVRFGRESRSRRAPRRSPSWQPVERHELPSDWDWVEDQARDARAATQRRVAVDPDPTPVGRGRR